MKRNTTLTLVVAVLIFATNSKAQKLNPQYLSQFPSVEQINAEVRGVDPLETAAKQSGAFWQLHETIALLAYAQKRIESKFTPDEQRLQIQYRNARYAVIKPFQNKLNGREQSRWNELTVKYEIDLWLRDELMKKYFTPEFRRAYYVAVKGQMPTENAPLGSTLVPTVAEITDASNRAKSATAAERVTPQSGMSASSSAEDYKAQGDKFIETKNYFQAVVAYKEAILLSPDDPRARERLAFAYFNLQRYPEAAAALQQAVRLKPDFTGAHFALGLAYLGMGQKDDALKVHKTLLTLNEKLAQRLYEEINKAPSSPPSNAAGGSAEDYKTQGDKYFQAADISNATEAYKKAIVLKPSLTDEIVTTYLYLGIYVNSQGRHQQAVAVYQQALVLESGNARLHVGLGEAYFKLNQYRESVAAYEQAIRLNPDLRFPKLKLNAEAHYGLGLDYLAMGLRNQALQVYRKLQRIDAKKAEELLAEINKK